MDFNKKSMDSFVVKSMTDIRFPNDAQDNTHFRCSGAVSAIHHTESKKTEKLIAFRRRPGKRESGERDNSVVQAVHM